MDEMYVVYLVGPLLLGLAVFSVVGNSVKAPGRALSKKFAAVGNLQGKSLDQIVNAVGCNPNSRTARPEGVEVIQWIVTGYHIALVFKDGKCQGVSHEFLQ